MSNDFKAVQSLPVNYTSQVILAVKRGIRLMYVTILLAPCTLPCIYNAPLLTLKCLEKYY